MHNSIILAGMLLEDPQSRYEPSGAHAVILSLHVPLPEQTPPAYWAMVYDLRDGDEFDRGSEEPFLVVCREALADICLSTWKMGDQIRVEGRLVITALRTPTIYGTEEVVPLAEVLASTITAVRLDDQ